jgi:hypothetical protein
MRVLLVTDDAGYGDEVAAAGDAVGMDVIVLAAESNVAGAVPRVGANIVVFDAGDDFVPAVRAAADFAGVHPHVVVCVVATGVDDHLNDGRAGDVLVVHQWRSPERLLDRLSRAYLGMRVATEPRASVGQ